MTEAPQHCLFGESPLQPECQRRKLVSSKCRIKGSIHGGNNDRIPTEAPIDHVARSVDQQLFSMTMLFWASLCGAGPDG